MSKLILNLRLGDSHGEVSALEPAGGATEVRLRREFEQTLEPGSVVFDEGDPGDQLYVIQSGEVELSREEAGGQRVVARLAAGDFFGEIGVVLGQPCSTRAVAITRTRVLCLDAETLEGMCLGQPEIAIRMIRVLAGRLIEAERRLAVLGVDDLVRPMVRALVRGATPSVDKRAACAWAMAAARASAASVDGTRSRSSRRVTMR